MNILRTLSSAMLLLSGVVAADAQLLKCNFKGYEGNEDNIAVYYSKEGTNIPSQMVPTKWDNGSCTCDFELSPRSNAVTIYVGNTGTFGAHLTKGKTLEMTITKEPGEEEKYTATFKGEGSDASAAVSAMEQAYNISLYFPQEGKTPSMEENRATLDKMYQATLPLLKKIKNKEQRAFYTELNEYNYKFMKVRLIQEDKYDNKKQISDYHEYAEITKDIDLNSDMSYRSTLGVLMISNMQKLDIMTCKDMSDYCHELMSLVDEHVTNPMLRKNFVEQIGQYYFAFGADKVSDYHKFYDEAVKWAAQDSSAITSYKSVIESWDKTKAGTKAFDITLTDAEGKNIQLLDLVKGKFAYIDVWATWCGPCKREIPNFARLAGQYNGKNDIIFISISVDEDVKAWKKMIDAEKPSWLQYNINGETDKKFSQQWGITGIPRFIMIDKNGNILYADAPRPSDAKAEEVLKSVK